MAAKWQLNSIDLYVFVDSDWMKDEHVAVHYPIGSNFAVTHWSCASQTHSLTAWVKSSAYTSLIALSGSVSYSLTGPGLVTGTVVIKSIVPRRFQDMILDGTATAGRSVTIEMERIA